MTRAQAARAALVVALAATVASTFLPWVRTGTRERNSYQLIAAARRLHVLEGTLERLAAPGWFFVPFLAALSVLALATGRPRLASGLGVAVGAGAVGLVIAVRAEPLTPLCGQQVTACVAAFTMVVSILLAALEWRR